MDPFLPPWLAMQLAQYFGQQQTPLPDPANYLSGPDQIRAMLWRARGGEYGPSPEQLVREPQSRADSLRWLSDDPIPTYTRPLAQQYTPYPSEQDINSMHDDQLLNVLRVLAQRTRPNSFLIGSRETSYPQFLKLRRQIHDVWGRRAR